MVATKVLISLCVFGVCLVSAAPQAGSGVNQDEAGIVTNVVTALQPQIAEAVAAALRGLSFGSGRTTSSTSTTTNTVAASNSGPPESTFTAGGRGASTSTGFGFSGSQVGFGSSGSRGGSAGGVGVSAGGSSGGAGSRVGVATGGSFGASGATEEVTARASYAYEYKVADDDEQTYISHNEARDGDEVTGQYSYIDPNGDLVTVTYQAGAMGYTQTVDREVGQVQIRQKDNQRAAVATSNVGASSTGSSAGGASSGFSFGSSSSGTGSSGFGASVASLPPPPVVAPAPQVVEETITTVTTTGTGGTRSSGGLDEAALIAQIISVLQPQINQAVTSVITQQ